MTRIYNPPTNYYSYSNNNNGYMVDEKYANPVRGEYYGNVANAWVTPGVPTPLELCNYENKLPTGVLHVTRGKQTVEFLIGVANMPSTC